MHLAYVFIQTNLQRGTNAISHKANNIHNKQCQVY